MYVGRVRLFAERAWRRRERGGGGGGERGVRARGRGVTRRTGFDARVAAAESQQAHRP